MSVRIPTAPDVYPVVAVMLLLLPAIVPPSEIRQLSEIKATESLTHQLQKWSRWGE